MLIKHTILLLLFFFIAVVTSAQVIPGKLIVKFKNNSTEFSEWLGQNRQGSIQSLTALIGEHTSQPYIRDALLQALRKRKELLALQLRQSDNLPLERIAVIEYKSDANPLLLASKLRTAAFCEYVEPLYERQLVSQSPDDSLFSDQYSLLSIKAVEAWSIIPSGSSVVIAITDTGVELTHPDLSDNLWVNQGEIGIDNTGKDRRSNGIDDDKNGFTDDWQGWDFFSDISNSGDNSPMPGNAHGTHVAGIAAAITNNNRGVAGTNPFAKIIPVKIGPDNPNSLSVGFGSEAILYAATLGADIINCSWGSSGYQQSEHEVIKEATNIGSCIVAACGNDNANTAFYPAAYPEVLSVASVHQLDGRSSFSNFHTSVDVSAPGSSIISTVPVGTYDYNSGTSMASPCAAAVTGLVKIMYPSYTPEQIQEHIKSTTDNIDSLTQEVQGLLGTGRINAYKAVTEKNVRSVRLLPVTLRDNNDDIYEPGEKIIVDFTIKNVLAPLINGKCTITSPLDIMVSLSENEFNLGAMSTNEEKSFFDKCTITIPKNCPPDYTAVFPVIITDDNNYRRTEYFSVLLNPTFRTINGNNFTLSLNSRGNLCYNDYPANTQGIGFRWKNSANLCYEAGLITASGKNAISNVVRSSSGNSQNKDFTPVNIISLKKPGIVSALDGTTRFSDKGSDSPAGLEITQTTYQFTEDKTEDILFLQYRVTNYTDKLMDSVYVGLFFDWDIGPEGANNYVGFDNSQGYGFCYNVNVDSLPVIGVQLLSPHELNFAAIDNEASIYNGFTLDEKWNVLTRGVWFRNSPIGDASMVIGAGKFSLAPQESSNVSFAIAAANRIADLPGLLQNAQTIAKNKGIAEGFQWSAIPRESSIEAVFPNPLNSTLFTLSLDITKRQRVTVKLYDYIGQLHKVLIDENMNAGKVQRQFTADDLSPGSYFIQMQQPGGSSVVPLQIAF
ncbi:MAG: S8 family serine peptidase [Ignavibacteria bacterium]|nr:S8 family serine peptidase [Ignavibacteria bacterium]